MKILLIFGLILLITLLVLNRIYIKRYTHREKEKLAKIQMQLWGYVGEPSENKKRELYKKYLNVSNK